MKRLLFVFLALAVAVPAFAQSTPTMFDLSPALQLCLDQIKYTVGQVAPVALWILAIVSAVAIVRKIVGKLTD